MEKQNWAAKQCWAAGCPKESTHVLTTKIVAHDVEQKVAYCLGCCIYFAAWLPYCYPGEYEVISITPPWDQFKERFNEAN